MEVSFEPMIVKITDEHILKNSKHNPNSKKFYENLWKNMSNFLSSVVKQSLNRSSFYYRMIAALIADTFSRKSYKLNRIDVIF